MRFTVTRKVIAGQATILVVGIVTFAAVYTGLTQLDEALRDHAEVHEPASAATYEMEINTNGTFMAVLKYLDRPDPASRARARKDLGDYERFFAQYMSLMQDEDGRKLGASLQGYYADFKTLAGLIMERRDEQEAIFVRVALHFETIDDIIGKQLLPWLEPSDPHRTAKVEHMTSVEADVAEVGIWVANYQRTHDPRYRALIAANEAELRKTLSRLEALPLSAPEQRWIRILTLKLNDVMRGLREIVALEDSLREDARRFVSLHQAMDDLLDEQVQMVARRQLERPILDAERATAAVLGRVRILIPVFVLTAFGVALLVIRLIRHPIRRLIHGTHLIASGDLSHRIAAGRDDEFGELGREFNRMVAELQETTVSRQLWSLTFDAIDSAIVVVDAERRVVQLNRAARELAGGSDGAVTRQILDDVGKGEPWRAAVTLARDMGQHGTAVAQHVQDEATGRSWEVAVNVFGRLDASSRQMVVVAREITRMIELQTTLHRGRTVAAMGALVAGVAHEVRNPLFGISSTIDAMEARFSGRATDVQRYVTVLRGESDRLATLMRDLLEYGRPVAPELVPGALSEVIDEAVAECQAAARQAGITIVNDARRADARVGMDRGRLVQVFRNLIDNAIQHSARGGSVTIDTEEVGTADGAAVVCRVRDSGRGFRPEDLPRVFEPFFTRRRGGTGLGLSIVQRITEEHRGRVTAANTPPGGGIVTVTLPVVAVPATAVA